MMLVPIAWPWLPLTTCGWDHQNTGWVSNPKSQVVTYLGGIWTALNLLKEIVVFCLNCFKSLEYLEEQPEKVWFKESLFCSSLVYRWITFLWMCSVHLCILGIAIVPANYNKLLVLELDLLELNVFWPQNGLSHLMKMLLCWSVSLLKMIVGSIIAGSGKDQLCTQTGSLACSCRLRRMEKLWKKSDMRRISMIICGILMDCKLKWGGSYLTRWVGVGGLSQIPNARF
jgi:hypothetical protein